MASRIADIARDDDGVAVSGASVSLRRESDNFEIDTTVTDSDGYFSFSEDEVGYPGPVKVIVTDVSGNTRQHSGRSTGQVGTIFMSDLNRAFLMMTDGVTAGVASELLVTSTGLTMSVTVGSGEAFIFGHPRVFASSTPVTIAANGSGNPRLDLIVIRLIPPGVAGEGETTFEVLQGTPAASPVAPGVTQDPNTKWELGIATVRVEPGASSIAGGKITDVRVYTSGPLQNSSVTTSKILDGAVTSPKIATEAVGTTKMTAGGTLSTSDTAYLLKAPTSGNQPGYGSMTIKELIDFSSDAPSAGQVPQWDAGTAQYKPTSLASASKPVLKEGATTKVASLDVLVMDAASFAVAESPTGTGTVTIRSGGITSGMIAGVTAAALPAGQDAAKIGDGSVSTTEFQYLANVTSDIQTQLNAKGTGDTSTNTSSSVDNEVVLFSGSAGKTLKRASLTASLVKSTSGILAAAGASDLPSAIDATKIGTGTVDNTEFGRLNGVTSDIQTQFTGKASTTHTHLLTDPLFDQNIAGYTAHSISTALTTVANKNTAVLTSGKRYFVYARADGQGNAPATGFIQMYVRIEAGGSNTPGTSTGVASGERPIWAQDAKIVVGTGSAINVAARAVTDTGTGSISDASVHFIIIPLDVPAS